MILRMEDSNSMCDLIICGVNVGSLNEGLVNKYDIETQAHIINLEGHIKRLIRENFGISMKSVADVEMVSCKLREERNQSIAEWFSEIMLKEIGA